MRKTRTSYLSYIEETPKHFSKLQRVARTAAKAAIKRAKNKNISITYLEDNWIIRENADGSKERIKHITTLSKKVNAGDKWILS